LSHDPYSSPGFHVVTLRRFEDGIAAQRTERKKMSIIQFLRLLESGDVPKYVMIDGFDDFMTRTSEEGLKDVRATLNEKLDILIENATSVVVITRRRIDDIPRRPSIEGKPLSLIFPRPANITTMKPGYVHYPIM